MKGITVKKLKRSGSVAQATVAFNVEVDVTMGISGATSDSVVKKYLVERALEELQREIEE